MIRHLQINSKTGGIYFPDIINNSPDKIIIIQRLLQPMKLIQQCKLFYREGNSDKVYEIDLCELPGQEYLVNFRYGRRGSTLKEGTKTPSAVSFRQAENIFSSLENEKRRKGYQTETAQFIALPTLDHIDTRSEKGAVLRRLQDAVEGKNSFATEWKTSRVIWKAGQLHLEEAIPFIIGLATKGDEMQLYAALRTLTLLKAQDAAGLFNSYATNAKQKLHIRNLATEGLLTVTTQQEVLDQLEHRIQERLPEEIRELIRIKDAAALNALIARYAHKGSVDYFSDLYLLCRIQPWLFDTIQDGLRSWPLRPPYFRQIRAIYKLARLRQDISAIAILSYRLEKEPAMFKRTSSAQKQQLHFLDKPVDVAKELKNKESRLAFSQYTKAYFQKDAAGHIRSTAQQSDARTYLKLAVTTLLQYRETDYTPAAELPLSLYGRYDYRSRRYLFTLYDLPECSESLLLSTILFGNDPQRKLQPNLKFITGKRLVTSDSFFYTPEQIVPYTESKISVPNNPITRVGSSIFNTLKNLFNRKKETSAPVQDPPENPEIPAGNTVPQRLELYPEHWDSAPEAYVQLLMQGRMNIIHRFAYNNLKQHPEATAIMSRFDEEAILRLLNSSFELPSQFGFEVLQKREENISQNPEWVGKILNSSYPPAQQWARTRIEKDPGTYLNNLGFVLLLLFNTISELEQWIKAILSKNTFTEERQQVILGKTVAELLNLENTGNNNQMAQHVLERLDILAVQQIERVSWSVLQQLIRSRLNANKILAGNILVRKARKTAITDIPVKLTVSFLDNDIKEVRQSGIQLLNQYPDHLMEENPEILLELTGSAYPDVLETVLARIGKLTANTSFSITALQHLVYALIRKEKFEGAHEQIIKLVTTGLKNYWNQGLQPKDISRLIHARYTTSQQTGYDILKQYPEPDNFSLRQIISFGNHELLVARQWCWQYFLNNTARIRYEKEKALNLLDAQWEDTRTFAFHFFRTTFTETDWDTDTLISITDAVRPDVESFGKELITRYFRPEDAPEYLRKLSEHPGINVQAFITNYLFHHAADQPELLQHLDFYFRSVLTRVNKNRMAKDRIFSFLRQEALKNQETALWATAILDDISAQSTIQDKATCIHILSEIKHKYPHLDMHLTIKN